MRRTAELHIDHFGWATNHEKKVYDFFDNLGFHMGDARPEGDKSFWMAHYYMEPNSAYINVYQLPDDGNMWPCKLDWVMNPDLPIEERLSDPAGVEGVYTYVISTKDVDLSRKLALQAGYNVSRVEHRRFSITGDKAPYFETIGGSSSSDMFAFHLRTEPYPNMMVGVMEHNDKYFSHFTRCNVHEYHPNGVTRVSAFTMYYETEEGVMNALKATHKMHDTMRPGYDCVGTTDVIHLIDKAAYIKEFGSEPPVMRSNVCAVEFENGDFDYIREAAKAGGYTWFEKDGKIYVDGRDTINSFLIFK